MQDPVEKPKPKPKTFWYWVLVPFLFISFIWNKIKAYFFLVTHGLTTEKLTRIEYLTPDERTSFKIHLKGKSKKELIKICLGLLADLRKEEVEIARIRAGMGTCVERD